ncbi:MAG: hypothetical protein PHH48_07540 [Eubacteriales bacterium]|nr:hypothetical protein [Eubacteriales bacterium]
MANQRKKSKKPKIKLRFYVFCALFILLVGFGIKSAIGIILRNHNSTEPAEQAVNVVEPSSVVMDNITKKEETPEKAGYTQITINFKDTEGNPIDMNIIPNCFITNVIEELQWKKAIYRDLLDIETSGKEDVNDNPNLTSYTGKKMTIKMSTKTEQYFRFIFIPLDKNIGYNPDLHKELNIYFTTTPADDGVCVEYDAILDYKAAMIDDVLNLKLVEDGEVKN